MSTAELGTFHVRSRPRERARRQLLRASGRAAIAAAAVVLLALGLYCAARLTGHQVLVDRGDSMRPALRSGDLLINRSVPAERLGVGDIVTFEDRPRRRSITHRVVRRAGAGSRVEFLTRGDANSASSAGAPAGAKRSGASSPRCHVRAMRSASSSAPLSVFCSPPSAQSPCVRSPSDGSGATSRGRAAQASSELGR